MFNRTNCDRKSQLSEILTEPLNQLDTFLSQLKRQNHREGGGGVNNTPPHLN